MNEEVYEPTYEEQAWADREFYQHDPTNPYEAIRTRNGWPTPMALQRAADGLDQLAVARFGDVLRWFADRCDDPAGGRLL